jgi:hypothetical protein
MEDEIAGHEASMKEMRNAYNILVPTSDGKRQLKWPRRRWNNNIRMGLREIG